MVAMAVLAHDVDDRWGLPAPQGDGWTVADLERLPDDDLQYEIFDGLLVVTGALIYRHQYAVSRLLVLLDAARPHDLDVMVAPLAFQPDNRNSAQPDVLVCRPPEDMDIAALTDPPLLAVEVLSRSTRGKDLLLKRHLYERTRIRSYWIVDPESVSLTVLELQGDAYVEVAKAAGNERLRVDTPFPVTVTPAELCTRDDAD